MQEAPDKWRRIAPEVTERLEMEPGKLFLPRTIRPTFVSIEEPFAAPITSPAPVSLVEGQFFGASLLAELCLDKFLSHLPLYRQSQAFLLKYGVDLPMSTLCDAIGSCARQVDIVVRHMNQELWTGGFAQMDLTPYFHWLFTKLPTLSAPNAGHFTPAAYAVLRTQGAPLAAVA